MDEFGSLGDAVEAAAQLAELGDDYGVTWAQPSLTWQEALALRMRSSLGGSLDFLGARAPELPLMPAALVPGELRLMLEMGRGGKPLYWCPCRVE